MKCPFCGHEITKRDRRIETENEGLYLMIGSSVFFIFGVPVGIVKSDLILILVECAVGLIVFIGGFMLHKAKRKELLKGK